MIYTVKGFSTVSKTEVGFFFFFFLEFSCFFYDPVDVGNLTFGPLPFLNPACVSGSSQFTYSQSLDWKILNITLLACEISAALL